MKIRSRLMLLCVATFMFAIITTFSGCDFTGDHVAREDIIVDKGAQPSLESMMANAETIYVGDKDNQFVNAVIETNDYKQFEQKLLEDKKVVDWSTASLANRKNQDDAMILSVMIRGQEIIGLKEESDAIEGLYIFFTKQARTTSSITDLEREQLVDLVNGYEFSVTNAIIMKVDPLDEYGSDHDADKSHVHGAEEQEFAGTIELSDVGNKNHVVHKFVGSGESRMHTAIYKYEDQHNSQISSVDCDATSSFFTCVTLGVERLWEELPWVAQLLLGSACTNCLWSAGLNAVTCSICITAGGWVIFQLGIICDTRPWEVNNNLPSRCANGDNGEGGGSGSGGGSGGGDDGFGDTGGGSGGDGGDNEDCYDVYENGEYLGQCCGAASDCDLVDLE